MRKAITRMATATLVAVFAHGVGAASPAFSPQIYGDGKVWGTKGTADLPAPNEYNQQSFDALYMVTNSNNPEVQLPISEAAPGNPDYNGGRWHTHTVEWTMAGFEAHGIVPVLKSYGDIIHHRDLGHLVIIPGSRYFECPLLPVK